MTKKFFIGRHGFWFTHKKDGITWGRTETTLEIHMFGITRSITITYQR